MKLKRDKTGRRGINSFGILLGFMIVLTFYAPIAGAQSQPADSKPCEVKAAETKAIPEAYQTFYLMNVAQQNDLTDIQTALRNLLPKIKLYSMPSQNAISMRGTPDDIQLAQKIITELDLPRRTYRLTFSVIETENGKRIGTQNFVLIAFLGTRTIFWRGLKVPIVTSPAKTGGADASAPDLQVQYQDVGLRIEATVEKYGEGFYLRTMVEQSSIAEEKAAVSVHDPVIRDSMLEGSSALVLRKPLVLGSFDLADDTRKEEIEVVAELVQ
jgi:type II secretory pathway component GspD/PulD (secretin)